MNPGAGPSTLLIVAGQSNALGYGVTRAELPPAVTADPRVLVWDDSGFATLRPGLNTGTERCPEAWGPEVEFARRWREDHPQGELYVVKVARGSAGLALDAEAPDWSPRSGKLFAEATRTVRRARTALPSPVETVILWHQGEKDAEYPAKAAAYVANLAEFRREALAAWADGAAVVVMARINGAVWEGNPVRAAQDAHGAYSTDGFPLQPDRLHLTGAGQIANGAAAYETYRRLRHARAQGAA